MVHYHPYYTGWPTDKYFGACHKSRIMSKLHYFIRMLADAADSIYMYSRAYYIDMHHRSAYISVQAALTYTSILTLIKVRIAAAEIRCAGNGTIYANKHG